MGDLILANPFQKGCSKLISLSRETIHHTVTVTYTFTNTDGDLPFSLKQT